MVVVVAVVVAETLPALRLPARHRATARASVGTGTASLAPHKVVTTVTAAAVPAAAVEQVVAKRAGAVQVGRAAVAMTAVVVEARAVGAGSAVAVATAVESSMASRVVCVSVWHPFLHYRVCSRRRHLQTLQNRDQNLSKPHP